MPLPFDSHRTMAEVTETEALKAKWDAELRSGGCVVRLTNAERRRLSELLNRASWNNPWPGQSPVPTKPAA